METSRTANQSNKSLDPLFGVIFTAVGVDYIHSSVVKICIWASEAKVTRTRSPNVLLSVIKHSVAFRLCREREIRCRDLCDSIVYSLVLNGTCAPIQGSHLSSQKSRLAKGGGDIIFMRAPSSKKKKNKFERIRGGRPSCISFRRMKTNQTDTYNINDDVHYLSVGCSH